MKDKVEERLAVGKKADALGLILTQVGAEYQVHSEPSSIDRPKFASRRLAEVDEYLDQLSASE